PLSPSYPLPLSLHDALPILASHWICVHIPAKEYPERHRHREATAPEPPPAAFCPRLQQRDCPRSSQAISASQPIRDVDQTACFSDRKSTRLNSSHVSISYAV